MLKIYSLLFLLLASLRAISASSDTPMSDASGAPTPIHDESSVNYETNLTRAFAGFFSLAQLSVGNSERVTPISPANDNFSMQYDDSLSVPPEWPGSEQNSQGSSGLISIPGSQHSCTTPDVESQPSLGAALNRKPSGLVCLTTG